MTDKIRILQVTQEPVTIWAFLLDLIKELQNRGYDVETACNNKDTDLIKEIEDKGIKVNVINIQRSLNPIKMLKAYREFRRLLKVKKFDAVVVHTPIASFIARFAAYFSKVPVIIYTAHGLPFMKGMNPVRYALFFMMEKLAGLVTTGLICINHEDYEAAKKARLVKPGYIKEIHGIGIDTEKFTPVGEKRKLRIENGELRIIETHKIVGFIGRLIESKGIKEFLAMAKSISEKRDDVIFLVVGFGPLESYVKEFITSNNLNKKVIYTGFIKEIKNIYQMLDVFALPTCYPEGMPRTMLEAMAMELPVVATDIRGCRELVEDGRTGYIVRQKDAEELARAVMQLLDDGMLRASMGQAGRAKAAAEYGMEQAIEEQAEFYGEIVRCRGGRPCPPAKG